MDLNTGNDGAVTAVDGSLFHTSIYIGQKKRILVGINKNGKKVVCHTMGLPSTRGVKR